MSDIRIWGKIFRAAADIIDKETEDKPRQRQRHIPSEPVDELAMKRDEYGVPVNLGGEPSVEEIPDTTLQSRIRAKSRTA